MLDEACAYVLSLKQEEEFENQRKEMGLPPNGGGNPKKQHSLLDPRYQAK